VLFEPIRDDLCFADVGVRDVCLRIYPDEDVNSSFFELLASEKVVELCSRRSYRLAELVGNLSGAQALRIASN
jgi:hypothetical protein